MSTPMVRLKHQLFFLALILLVLTALPGVAQAKQKSCAGGYDELLALFDDWRKFEIPPLLNGAPDYTANTTALRHWELKKYQECLVSFDITDWPIAQQVDWHLLRAEMNGMDFNVRVLMPWVRDPGLLHVCLDRPE